MAATAQRTPVILPVLLAVIGVASLATAVMLVPVIIRQSVAQFSATTPQPISTSTAAAGGLPIPATGAGQVTSAPVASDASGPQPQDASPAETASQRGPWALVLDSKSYALDQESEAVLSQIVAFMGSRPKANVALVGVNNPMRSSKRAKEAARRIKESLIEAGVERYRISVAGAQEEGAKGLVVRAEVAGEQP